MLSIKSFQDGDRFVVVFEGLKGPSDQELITSYINSVVSSQVEAAKPVEARPVEQDTRKPEIPEDNVFIGGVYDGMTPDEVIKNGRAKGFFFLTEMKDSPAVSDELRADIITAINGYLKNFDGCEADKYAAKLSEKQVDTFLKTYQYIIPVESRVSPDASYEDKRKTIEQSIRYFQNR